MTTSTKGPEDYSAPKGTIWVCTACGKTSLDRVGDRSSTHGWDVSCFLKAILCKIDSLVVSKETGRVTAAKAFDPEETT